MSFRLVLIPLFVSIFFFIFFISPRKADAQASCTLEEVSQTCGAGNFACITIVPTAVPDNAWIKVKASSFSANSDSTFSNFTIPTTTTSRYRFNESDPDDSANIGRFMIGDSVVAQGVLTAPDTGNIAGNISQNDWKIDKYKKKKTLNPRKFLDYAKSRKDTHTLTTLSDIPVPNQINIYTGTNFVIDGSNVDNFRTGNLTGPTVVIIDGNLSIQRNINYKTQAGYVTNVTGYTPQPLTILVTGDTTITSVNPNEVNQINAILVTKNLIINAMATPDLYGLKIKGNLIVTGIFTNNRVRSESRRPTLFIVLDPEMYTSLLPYFSIAQYEWKQVQ